MKKIIKKILIFTFIIILVTYRPTLQVYALEAPTAPSAPTELSQPTNELVAPDAPTAPSAPDVPTLGEAQNTESDSSRKRENNNTQEENQESTQSSTNNETTSNENNSTLATSPSSTATGETTGGQESDGNPSAPAITTGNATTNGVISNVGNTNTSLVPSDGGSASVINSGNGASSTNNGSSSISDNSNTLQNNNAGVTNNMNQEAVSGENSASENIGGASIETGDSNVSGTVVNSVNTNVDGVAVYEFNVADTHVGDIVLDYGSMANCISGCGGTDTTVSNTGNGADSTNTASATNDSTNNTFQNNDADVLNDMTLVADSGSNKANDNLGGDTSITTGDANVNANVLTFANNNISGNVVYGVVNIYGTLVGDIVLPEDALVCSLNCGSGQTAVSNTGNGADSTNVAVASNTTNDNTFQTNDATIENNIVLDANTGDNKASDNLGGTTGVNTGNADTTVQTVNVANSNVDGGEWWLVIVNEAGKWVGKLLGAPDGSNYAGSVGTEFAVDSNGEITVTNNGNGEGSTNTATVSQTSSNTTVQSNNANIVNNLNLTANTGGNSASQNGGGNVSVETGDATIVANLVNFVNNNITGGGRLVVTVVNVFGEWMGDFVTPGTQKQNNNQQTQQNQEMLATQKGSMRDSASNSNDSFSSSSDTTNENEPTPEVKLAIASSKAKKNSGIVLSGATLSDSQDPEVKKSASSSESVVAEETAPKKKVNINLAWMMLGVPLFGAYFVQRKYSFLSIAAKRFASWVL